MPEKMSISVNGDSRVPPGFRFHPTEEELLQYYLRKKVGGEPIDLDVICEVDLNKLEPWDIQERCKIGSTPQNDWYFFSHKDKKYPTGTRANRATTAGFWKATGRDKMIYSTSTRLRIGMRKTLVFYMGRAPHGQKSDWIIHEYRLVDDNSNNARRDNNEMIDVQVHKASDAEIEERWVVCRIFKKNYHKAALDSPNIKNITSTDSADNNLESSTQPNNYNTLDRYYSTSPAPSDHDEGALEHIFRDFTRTLKGTEIHDQSKDAAAMNIIRLPYLVENPNSACSTELACHDHYLRHGQYGLQLPPPTNCDVLAFGSEKQQLISSFSTRELIGYDGDVNRLDVSATNTAAPAETTNKITDSSAGPIKNWAAFDRLVASHLNMSFSQPPDHDHDDGPYSHHDLHHIFRSSSTSDISSSSRVDFDGPSSDPDYVLFRCPFASSSCSCTEENHGEY